MGTASLYPLKEFEGSKYEVIAFARRCLILFLGLCFFTLDTKAQLPKPTVAGSTVSLSLGYTYFTTSAPSANRMSLNGTEAALTIDVVPRVGLKADLFYVRTPNVLNSGKHSDILGYLGGPIFYAVKNPKITVFAQGLLGGARETGVVRLSGGQLLTGYVNQTAWMLGVGGEKRVGGALGFRVGGDYVGTAFANPALAIIRQNGFRATGSIVFYFDRRSHRRL